MSRPDSPDSPKETPEAAYNREANAVGDFLGFEQLRRGQLNNDVVRGESTGPVDLAGRVLRFEGLAPGSTIAVRSLPGITATDLAINGPPVTTEYDPDEGLRVRADEIPRQEGVSLFDGSFAFMKGVDFKGRARDEAGALMRSDVVVTTPAGGDQPRIEIAGFDGKVRLGENYRQPVSIEGMTGGIVTGEYVHDIKANAGGDTKMVFRGVGNAEINLGGTAGAAIGRTDGLVKVGASQDAWLRVFECGENSRVIPNRGAYRYGQNGVAFGRARLPRA